MTTYLSRYFHKLPYIVDIWGIESLEVGFDDIISKRQTTAWNHGNDDV